MSESQRAVVGWGWFGAVKHLSNHDTVLTHVDDDPLDRDGLRCAA